MALYMYGTYSACASGAYVRYLFYARGRVRACTNCLLFWWRFLLDTFLRIFAGDALLHEKCRKQMSKNVNNL